MTAIRWVRQWGGRDRIVWVDVRKLNRAWMRDRGFYIPVGTGLRLYKYNRFGLWLAQHGGTRVHMPHIDVSNNVVCFTDGRHRFAWMRDHGATSLPVTVATARDAAHVTQLFGACDLPAN